jgi:carbonic anhydrase/acetyltransferase-like protein (isoleucine patch superfamily)
LIPGARRARLAAWAARHRGRLVLDAPHGASFADPPLITGDGRLTLRIGRGVDLGRHTVLQVSGDGVLELGDATTFGQGARVWLRGGAVRLGARVQVRDVVVLKSDGELRAGDGVLFGHAAVLGATREIAIGAGTSLGERVSVVDSDHDPAACGVAWDRRELLVDRIAIGANVLVGANAVILRGARIGDGAVIGANAVVRGGEHEGGWVYTGVPALARRRLSE